jgi:PKD repeat protein
LRRRRPISLGVGIIAAAVLAAGFVVLEPSRVTGAVGDVGVPGPSYRGAGAEPVGSKPESKLWWNDGYWWGSLWAAGSRNHHIFRLDPTQRWADTGVRVDNRSRTRADVLWDGRKLYVASHVYGTTPAPGFPARLYRYSYEAASKRYSLDAGFPTTINDYRSETLVIDKDSTGRLWATWVQGKSVYISHTTDGDRGWAAPFVLPVSGAAGLSSDDISSLVAFGGSKVGVMWSNQKRDSIFFAVHLDGQPPSKWRPVEIALGRPFRPDDHINVKADSEGRVLAVVRTHRTSATAPQVLLLARAATGTWSRHAFGTGADKHGRAILLLDEENDRVHVFATSSENKGTVYTKAASLRAPRFGPGVGTPFLRSTASATMNNPTSTKQPVSGATGAVVVGGLGSTGRYWHNALALPAKRPAEIEAELVGSPTSGFAPLTVSFSDRSSVAVSGRTWNFGDGSRISTDANPVHTYEDPGTYTVTLTVWNGNDSEHTRTRRAYVTVLPLDAEFSTSRTSGRVPLYVKFQDESSGTIVSRLWDFGDGTTSTEANPAKVYRTGGLFTVRLTVTDRAGRWTTSTKTAHVNALPLVADFTAAPLAGPAPLTTHFSDGTLGSPTQWLWDFGDGATSAAKSPSHVYTDPGTYAVSLTVTDAAGNTNTRTRWAYVKAEQLTADFIAKQTIGPAPLVVAFADRSTGRPAGWSWNFGDGTRSTAANPAHRYRLPGAYTVQLTVRDADGDVSTRTKTSYVTATSDFVVRPSADADVRSAHANTNTGAARTIRAGNRGRLARDRAYLAFDVPTLPGTLVSAKLRLFVTSPSTHGGELYAVSNEWTESGLRWANAPTILGSPLGRIGNSPAGQWVETALPIGTFTDGPGRYSFALTQGFEVGGVAFASREASTRRRPQLVLAVDYGPKNTPPDARGDLASTDEDTGIVVDVVGNDDPGFPEESDESVSLAAITARPDHGSARIVSGKIAYVPHPNYYGADSLGYRVCDSGADPLCSTARLRISVLPVNDAPGAPDDAVATNEDGARVLGLLENDVAGPENERDQTLSIEAVTSPPEHGRVQILAGKAVYTPAPDYNGPDTLTYRVCDDGVPRMCSMAKASISVAFVNDAPRASADAAVIDEDMPTLVPVLANDSGGRDEAAQGLRIGGLISLPAHGTAAVEADGVRYSPDHDYHGRDSFGYRVCDDGDPSLCSTGVVNVDVLSVNDLPAARDDAALSDEDSHVAVEVLANDGPGELEQFIQLEHLLSPPSHGTAEIDDGRVIYTPTPDYYGRDALSYRACDNGKPRFCVEASVAITVMPVNDPPRADPDTAVVQEEFPTIISVLADDDAGPRNERAEGLFIDGIAVRPNHGKARLGIGVVSYTPDPHHTGRDWFSYRLCDGGDPSLCAIGVVEIEIFAANDRPRPKDDVGVVTGGAPISLDVLLNDDAGPGETGQLLQLSGIVWSPAHGTAVEEAGRIRYTPAGDYHGYDSLVYRACDDGSPERCSTATVAIRLLPGIGSGSRPRLQSEAHTGAIRFRRGRFSGRAASRGPRSAS